MVARVVPSSPCLQRGLHHHSVRGRRRRLRLTGADQGDRKDERSIHDDSTSQRLRGIAIRARRASIVELASLFRTIGRVIDVEQVIAWDLQPRRVDAAWSPGGQALSEGAEVVRNWASIRQGSVASESPSTAAPLGAASMKLEDRSRSGGAYPHSDHQRAHAVITEPVAKRLCGTLSRIAADLHAVPYARDQNR